MKKHEKKRDTVVVTLSCALKATPASLTKDGQLRLVGKGIMSVDMGIPSSVADQILTVYLSDNFIRSLGGVVQFRNLKAASLNNNSLRYLEDLHPLSRCPRLEKLSLEGNVVTRMPYYRQHVICLCPALVKLDDVVISRGERTAASSEHHRFVSFYDKLRENELRNVILVHISKVMACHMELRKHVVGKFSHLLGDHIGSERSLRVTEAPAGQILRQALEGGVFCWMQRMDGAHLSRTVQDTLYKLLVTEQQSGGAALQSRGSVRPISIAGTGAVSAPGSGALTELWDRLVKGYLQEQYDFYLDLSRYCEHLLRTGIRLRAAAAGPGWRPGTSREEEAEAETAEAQELLDRGVERVRFLTPVRQDTKVAAALGACCSDMLCLQRGPSATERTLHPSAPVAAAARKVSTRTPLVSVVNVIGTTGAAQLGPETKAELQSRKAYFVAAAGKENYRSAPGSGESELPPPPPPPPPPSPLVRCPAPVQHTQVSAQPQGVAYSELSHPPFPPPAQVAAGDGVVRRSWGDAGSALETEAVLSYADNRKCQVRSRYEQLLGRNAGKSATAAARGADFHPAAPLTVQAQERDVNQQNAGNAAQEGDMGFLVGPGDENVATPPGPEERSAKYSPELLEEIDAFFERALSSALVQQGKSDDGSTEAAAALPAYLEALSQDFEARFLLATHSAQEFLEGSEESRALEETRVARAQRQERPSPPRPSAEALGGNIHALHVHIKGLSSQCSLRTVEAVTVFKLHESLLGTAEQLRRHALGLADSAERALDGCHKEVEAVLRDARTGAVHLQVLQQGLSRVQEVQGQIEDLRALTQGLLAAEADALSGRDAALVMREAVKADTQHVSSSLQASTNDLQTNPMISGLVRRQKLEVTAEEFWARSRARNCFLKKMFLSLRSRVRRQRRVRDFAQMHRSRCAAELKVRAFEAWKNHRRVLAIGARLQRWRERRVKGAILGRWLHSYAHQSHTVPAVQQLARVWALRRAFLAFRRSQELARRDNAVGARQALACTLFWSIRVFRAWKALTDERKRLRCEMGRGVEQWRMGRLFGSWHQAARDHRAQMDQNGRLTQRQSHMRRIGLHFTRWRRLFLYRLSLCQYRRKRRFFLRFLKCLATQSRQKALLHSVTGFAHFALRRCLSRWTRWLWMLRALRRARARAGQLDAKRTLAAAWAAWRVASLRCGHIYRAAQLVRERADTYVLQRCFGEWIRGTSFASVQRSLDTARDRWLRLFEGGAPPRPPGSIFWGERAPAVQRAVAATEAPTAPSNRENTARRFRQKVQARLLALGPEELQMLSWESDSDSDSEAERARHEENNKNSDDTCVTAFQLSAVRKRGSVSRCTVLCRRYLARWLRRHAHMGRLRAKEKLSRRVAERGVTRRAFNGMMRAWLSVMAATRAELGTALREEQASEQRAEGLNARMERGSLEQATNSGRDLRETADELVVALTTAKQQQEQRQQVLRDLDSSLSALCRQRASMEDEAEAARAYARGVQSRCEEAVQPMQEQGPAAPEVDQGAIALSVAFSSIIARLIAAEMEPVSDRRACMGTSVALQPVIGATLSPGEESEHLLLMQDVEALYAQAVAAQEKLQRQRQHLANQRAAAATLLGQRQQQSAQLDTQIEALRVQRVKLETALAECTDRLGDSLSSSRSQTDYHEARIEELIQEEVSLTERLSELQQEERCLEDRLTSLQERRRARLAREGAHTAQQQARAAALATDLLLTVEAAVKAESGAGRQLNGNGALHQGAVHNTIPSATCTVNPALQVTQFTEKVALCKMKAKRGAGGSVEEQPSTSTSTSTSTAGDNIDREIDALAARIRSRLEHV